MGNKNKRIEIRIPEDFLLELDYKSNDLGMSRSAYIEYCIRDLWSKETDDESLYIYHLQNIQKDLKKLSLIVDEQGTLFIDYLSYFFSLIEYVKPDFGNLKGQALEEKKKLVKAELDLNRQKTIEFLSLHRVRIQKGRTKSFLEQLFGEMLEEDSTFDKFDLLNKDIKENGPEE